MKISMMTFKKIRILFVAAFTLNLVWENLHSFLYVHYKGSRITELILFRAAVVDAIIIVASFLLLKYFFREKFKPSFMLLIGLIIAVVLESWALGGDRWAYTEAMPIIPIIKTGLSPTIQLALTGYLSSILVFKK